MQMHCYAVVILSFHIAYVQYMEPICSRVQICVYWGVLTLSFLLNVQEQHIFAFVRYAEQLWRGLIEVDLVVC